MTDVGFLPSLAVSRTRRNPRRVLTPRLSRILLASLVIGTAGLSFAWVDAEATSRAVMQEGSELTRLLRFMAAVKGVLALGAVGAVLWRLGSAIGLGRFVAYGACCAVMVTGPGLIWGMAHVGLGALLLHGGLFGLIVLLWRDPAVPVRLEAALARRRLACSDRSDGVTCLERSNTC